MSEPRRGRPHSELKTLTAALEHYLHENPHAHHVRAMEDTLGTIRQEVGKMGDKVIKTLEHALDHFLHHQHLTPQEQHALKAFEQIWSQHHHGHQMGNKNAFRHLFEVIHPGEHLPHALQANRPGHHHHLG
jgi:hypothetical protein